MSNQARAKDAPKTCKSITYSNRITRQEGKGFMNNEAMLRSHDRVSKDEGRRRVTGRAVHPTLDPIVRLQEKVFL